MRKRVRARAYECLDPSRMGTYKQGHQSVAANGCADANVCVSRVVLTSFQLTWLHTGHSFFIPAWNLLLPLKLSGRARSQGHPNHSRIEWVDWKTDTRPFTLSVQTIQVSHIRIECFIKTRKWCRSNICFRLQSNSP